MTIQKFTQINFQKEDKEDIIDKLAVIIEYDNTNEEILKKYLLLLKETKINIFNDKLEEFYYHISPTIYEEIKGEKKPKSSIEMIRNCFQLFENYEKDNVFIQAEIINYFYKNKIKVTKTNYKYLLKDNIELSLIDLYYLMHLPMQKKNSIFIRFI